MSRPQNLSLHIKCLEETGHHVEAHMIAALGFLRKDDIKAELCIVVHSMMNVMS